MAPSSIHLGESEIENRYFHHLLQTAAVGLDGAWGWLLWNKLMPQASHQELFVRHSIMAIGALLKSHEAAYSVGAHPHAFNLPDVAKLHRDFAMIKYDTAVKLMRKAGIAMTTNPRQALLGCVFVVCFEMLMGNGKLAMKHAQSGTIILQRWRAQIAAFKENVPLLSPAPLTVEDEIVEAFRNLDIQITTLWDDCSAACHEEVVNGHSIIVTALPTTFPNPSMQSLREAQVYLNLIVRRIHHFITTIGSQSGSMAPSKRPDGDLPGDFSAMQSLKVYNTSFKVTDAIRNQQVQFTTEIANWMRAFAPLFETLCITKAANEASFSCAYNAAAMMHIQAAVSTILTAGIVITNEMEYDKFNPRFREIVDLAAGVVKMRQRRSRGKSLTSGFWIDIGITPQLFVVVTRCRNPILRRRAIDLLEGWCMEGSWDPRLIAQVGLFIMEVEEEGFVDLDWRNGENVIIPEKARAVLSGISKDSETGRALIQCVLKNGGVDGGPVWKEKLVEL